MFFFILPQAYRGPSEGKGYDTFAPWGFYVTQPKGIKYQINWK